MLRAHRDQRDQLHCKDQGLRDRALRRLVPAAHGAPHRDEGTRKRGESARDSAERTDGAIATAVTAWRFSLPIRALPDIRFDFERRGTE